MNVRVNVYYDLFGYFIKAWWIFKPKLENGYIVFNKPLGKRYYIKILRNIGNDYFLIKE